MREVKFRGISIETGEFIYGGIWQPHDPLCDKPNKEVYIVVTEDLGDVLGSEIIEVDPETVGEFTGFTDKNEVDIYEGDIVKVQDPYNGNWSTNGAEVVFSHSYVGGWVISDSRGRNLNLGSRQERLQIIGSIHHNPESLS